MPQGSRPGLSDRWGSYLRDVVIVAVGVFLLIEQAFDTSRSEALIGAAVTLLITPAVLRARKPEE